ncbi:DUF975 family protein [Enterococcus sp. LJL99]
MKIDKNSYKDKIQQYDSWQGNSKLHEDWIYNKGYDDGWFDGYYEYEEDYQTDGNWEEDIFDDNGKQNLSSLSALSIHENAEEKVATGNPATNTTTFPLIPYLILGVGIHFLIRFYNGFMQWLALDMILEREFTLRKTAENFFKVNGKKMLKANLLMSLYTFFWLLLLLIPGIVKALSYSMTNYLLKRNAKLSSSEAMRISSDLMNGYKAEYLIFVSSFIFWKILNITTLGVSNIYVAPYYNTAKVLFFDQIMEETGNSFEAKKETLLIIT